MNDVNNKLLQQQVQLQRVANGLIRDELIPSLKLTAGQARLLLLDIEQITSPSQLSKITKEIALLVDENATLAWKVVTDQFNDLAISEAGVLTTVIGGALGVEASKKTNIVDYIAKSLMSLDGNNPLTGTWAEFVKNNVSGQAQVINNQIKAAYVNGETMRQAAKRIQIATGGILRHRAEGLARTGISHYSAQTTKAVFEDNSDIIKRERPIVTFDSRLSVTCASIGGKYGVKGWPMGESPIGYPPYHHNCRTVIGAVIEGFEDDLGNDVNEWMAKQPESFKVEVLGAARAQAFNDGVKLDKFTDMTGNPLTVKDLINRSVIKPLEN